MKSSRPGPGEGGKGGEGGDAEPRPTGIAPTTFPAFTGFHHRALAETQSSPAYKAVPKAAVAGEEGGAVSRWAAGCRKAESVRTDVGFRIDVRGVEQGECILRIHRARAERLELRITPPFEQGRKVEPRPSE